MSNYQSLHTGQEIDEAVAKSLKSTKLYKHRFRFQLNESITQSSNYYEIISTEATPYNYMTLPVRIFGCNFVHIYVSGVYEDYNCNGILLVGRSGATLIYSYAENQIPDKVLTGFILNDYTVTELN